MEVGKLKTGLSKDDSQVIKGVAIFLMMWHHSFLEGRFEEFTISFFPFSAEQVSQFAYCSKICVSLFAFVSGYGLYLAYSHRKKEESVSRWIAKRYLKSFLPIWFVIAFCWIVTFVLDGRPAAVYFAKGRKIGMLYMAFDFLGLSNLFDTPSLMGTWWYLTAFIAFIVLTPLLVDAIRKYGGILCFAALMLLPRCINGFPGGKHFLTFLPAFLIGMLFAGNDVFARFKQKTEGSISKAVAAALLSLAMVIPAWYLSCILSRKQFWDLTLGLFTGIYATAIFFTFCRFPAVSKILQFLGRHSLNIYLTHGVIRSKYCSEFIYGRVHFALVILTLLLSSLVVSLVIEALKKLFKFDTLQRRVLEAADRDR